MKKCNTATLQYVYDINSKSLRIHAVSKIVIWLLYLKHLPALICRNWSMSNI
jgi:hypothetical protein